VGGTVATWSRERPERAEAAQNLSAAFIDHVATGCLRGENRPRRCAMTFEEAMQLIRDHEEEYYKVRRSVWDRHLAVNHFFHYGLDATKDQFDRVPTMWDLDNGEGSTSGSYWIYKPTPEDMEATDWEVYDAKKLWPEDELGEREEYGLGD
jgi:hypothetical protein